MALSPGGPSGSSCRPAFTRDPRARSPLRSVMGLGAPRHVGGGTRAAPQSVAGRMGTGPVAARPLWEEVGTETHLYTLS